MVVEVPEETVEEEESGWAKKVEREEEQQRAASVFCRLFFVHGLDDPPTASSSATTCQGGSSSFLVLLQQACRSLLRNTDESPLSGKEDFHFHRILPLVKKKKILPSSSDQLASRYMYVCTPEPRASLYASCGQECLTLSLDTQLASCVWS